MLPVIDLDYPFLSANISKIVQFYMKDDVLFLSFTEGDSNHIVVRYVIKYFGTKV